MDLVLAFADQVAIALGNAALLQELQRRNRELSTQSRRIEELLLEREAEVERLTEQVARQQPSVRHRHDYGSILGSSAAIDRAFDLLDRVIDTDLTVLIEGESGTGKELIARAIHQDSSRRARPLVSINCAALPEALLEAELLGYCRGPFTGAVTRRDGLFVQARGGTLFLDEIGEMPTTMQAKLLRVLQEHEVRPLGADRAVPVDVRLVCATNRHLPTEVAHGRFREDLYYRVGAVVVRVPPLRERLEDLPLLAGHLLCVGAERIGRKAPELTRAALRKLSAHAWPGNVRKLENVLLRALVMSHGDRIGPRDLELGPPPAPLPPLLDRATYAELRLADHRRRRRAPVFLPARRARGAAAVRAR
ncbi:MAG: sigma-54-dependent Fis family transcriptional regulator [Polyangiaceae bacterium]|nr:sigma-54-dependent Fis family transcriptional regulator [Polyangiaceae bacterium]